MWKKVSIVITVLLVVTLGISLHLWGEEQSEEKQKDKVRKIIKGTFTATISFQKDEEAKLLYLKVRSLRFEERYKDAFEVCKKMMEEYPDSDYLLPTLIIIGDIYSINMELRIDELRKNPDQFLKMPFETSDPVIYLLVEATIKGRYLYWTRAYGKREEEECMRKCEDEFLQNYYEILNKYPESRFADEAQWYIGNWYYSRYDFNHAIEEFQKVIDRYPDSNSAPAARHEIGTCYYY